MNESEKFLHLAARLFSESRYTYSEMKDYQKEMIHMLKDHGLVCIGAGGRITQIKL